jgi:hypothetical protein
MSADESTACANCSCSGKMEEQTLEAFWENTSKLKKKHLTFFVCENSQTEEACELCNSPMKVHTYVTAGKNSVFGHYRRHLCSTAGCNGRRYILKRTGLRCPRCNEEIGEMSDGFNKGGMFRYQCLDHAIARAAHGIPARNDAFTEKRQELAEKTSHLIAEYLDKKSYEFNPEQLKSSLIALALYEKFLSAKDKDLPGILIAVNPATLRGGYPLVRIHAAPGKLDLDVTEELNKAINAATNNEWTKIGEVINPPEKGCAFIYNGIPLLDGPNHEPNSACSNCGSSLAFREGEPITEDANLMKVGTRTVEIYCPACDFVHNEKSVGKFLGTKERKVKLKK